MTSVAFDTDVHAAVFDQWCWWICAELGCSPMKLTFFDTGADVTKSSSTWRLIRDARRMGTWSRRRSCIWRRVGVCQRQIMCCTAERDVVRMILYKKGLSYVVFVPVEHVVDWFLWICVWLKASFPERARRCGNREINQLCDRLEGQQSGGGG